MSAREKNTEVDGRKRARLSGSLAFAARMLIFVMVCGILYWGSAIFVPVALAILLSFILSPTVKRLHRWRLYRWRLPRVASVIVVVALATAAIGTLLWAVTSQVATLAKDIPNYRETYKAKLSDIRGVSKGGSIEKIQTTIEEVSDEIEAEEQAEEAEEAAKKAPPKSVSSVNPAADSIEPVAVTVVTKGGLFDWQTLSAMKPLATMLGQAGLVFILVILLLLAEHDLHDRIGGLAGEARLAVTTTALTDAGRRISRYLGTQLILNASYGVVVGIGLTLLGVPYAVLWGICSAVFRYIPYVGPWVAALWPIAISLLVSSSWWPVVWVIALFVTLELVSNNILEPLLFGRSVGIPAFILVVAAVFWTWLWGPVGLVLSTPLTVCLVVIGEHVESLRILSQLLGSRTQVPAQLLLYQRLLALDEEEAAEMIEGRIPQNGSSAEIKSGVDEVSRTLLEPLLSSIKRDSLTDALNEESKYYILQFLDSRIAALTASYSRCADRPESLEGRILLCPASDEVDETAARLLALVLKTGGVSCSVLSSTLLASEVGDHARQASTRLLCIVSVGPGGLPACLTLWKQLSRLGLDAKIAVNCWGVITERGRKSLQAAGAEWVANGLAEADKRLTALGRDDGIGEPSAVPSGGAVSEPVPVQSEGAA